MPKRIAFLIYTAGIILIIGLVVSAFSDFDESPRNWGEAVGGLVSALVVWWISAGIGIRLGVFPIDFFRSIARSLGLGHDAPIEGATRKPSPPSSES